MDVYLDVALGLALTFLLLSVAVSALNEGINRVLRIRSEYFWSWVHDVFDRGAGDRARLPRRFRDVILGFVRQRARPAFGVTDGDSWANQINNRLSTVDRPSLGGRTSINYVPPEAFAAALVSVMEDKGVLRMAPAGAGTVPMVDRLDWSAVNPPLDPAAARPSDPRPVERDGGAATPPPDPHDVVRMARSELDMQCRMAPDAAALQQRLAAWFDDEMARLTRMYRRQAKWVLVLPTLALVLFSGIDATELYAVLKADAAFRATTVAASPVAEKLASSCAPEGGDSAVDVQICVSDSYRAIDAVSLTRYAVIPDAGRSFSQSWETYVDHLQGSAGADGLLTDVKVPGTGLSLGRLIGMTVTFFAVWMGAPFWFDILRRLTGVRRVFVRASAASS